MGHPKLKTIGAQPPHTALCQARGRVVELALAPERTRAKTGGRLPDRRKSRCFHIWNLDRGEGKHGPTQNGGRERDGEVIPRAGGD